MKAFIGWFLLAFAIFTLGFGFGREAERRRSASVAGEPSGTRENSLEKTAEERSVKVVVYYLHTAFRCVTCNEIERIARETLENKMPDLLASGKVEWRVLNFQQREDLAKRYAVASSSIVVVQIKDGKEASFRRLDEAWTLHDDPERLAALIADTVKNYLE